MKRKIKNWLIRKLGGITVESVPIHILNNLHNYWVSKTVDSHAAEIFRNGFEKTYYSEPPAR